MRPILQGDINAAARALMLVPVASQRLAAQRMLHEADTADRFRQKTGRAHPVWGNGSLMAAANARPQKQMPRMDDVEYCTLMALFFDVLLAWRQDKAVR